MKTVLALCAGERIRDPAISANAYNGTWKPQPDQVSGKRLVRGRRWPARMLSVGYVEDGHPRRDDQGEALHF